MATVQDILAQAGVSTYDINSIDPNVMQGFQNVLSEAERNKQSVDEFWSSTFQPAAAELEQRQAESARKLAAKEAELTSYRSYIGGLKEHGVITDNDLPVGLGSAAQPRNDGGHYMSYQTPGTPTFDPNDVVSRASRGLAAIADADWRHRQLYGKPMDISPSQLIAEADAQGLDPATSSVQVQRKAAATARRGD